MKSYKSKKSKYFLGGALPFLQTALNIIGAVTDPNKQNDHASSMPPLAMFQTNKFAHGGQLPEAEGGEKLIRNGQIIDIKGPKHEHGGVPLIPQLGSLPEYVLSDRIGFDKSGHPTSSAADTKQTFASIADKLGEDDISESTVRVLQKINQKQIDKVGAEQTNKYFNGGVLQAIISAANAATNSPVNGFTDPKVIPTDPVLSNIGQNMGLSAGSGVNTTMPTTPTAGIAQSAGSATGNPLGLTNGQLGALGARLPALIGNAAISFSKPEVEQLQLNQRTPEVLSRIRGTNVDLTEQFNAIDRATAVGLDTVGQRASGSGSYLANAQNILANAMNARASTALNQQQANNQLAFQKANVEERIGETERRERIRKQTVDSQNRGARLSNISAFLSQDIPALSNQISEFDVVNQETAQRKAQAESMIKQNAAIIKDMYGSVGGLNAMKRYLKATGFSKKEIDNLLEGII